MDNFKELLSAEWDIVVIGTGMGGATLGYHTAKNHKKVLFLEKGKYYPENHGTLYNNFAETFLSSGTSAEFQGVYADAGRWHEPFFCAESKKEMDFIPFIGSGAGGSSALYGGAMERFFAEDFYPAQYHGDPESTLPDQWPVTYGEMAGYYEFAEELYRIHGSPDPLRRDDTFKYLKTEKMHAASEELFSFLKSKKLTPYRLPIAYDPDENCQGCQGFLCQYKCKNDSSKICLEPAITKYGAGIIDQCDVIRLESGKDTVEKVVFMKNGELFKVSSKLIVLAAGAVMSPLILLDSKNSHWPQGVGNNSGLVGKNLMRHHIDLYAIFPKSQDLPGNAKEIAFNDYYLAQGAKYGTVQAFGALPPSHVLVEELQQEIAKKISRPLSIIFSLAKPLVSYILNKIFSKAIILASIKEDLPYLHNQVQLKNSSPDDKKVPLLTYSVSTYEKKRIKKFRRTLLKQFKPYKVMLLKQSENIERIAHVCGTCRFGDDPETSVLDKYNQVHGMTNLFVVDSSFFPSSGGTNPSLTIAANAIRVADYILSKK